MTLPEKRNRHRPIHIYDGHTYFVTGRCYKKRLYLERDEYKKVFKQVLEDARKRFKINLFSWAVLHNHYHLLFALPQKWDESLTSVEIKRNDKMSEANFTIDDGVTVFAPRGAQSVIPCVQNERDGRLTCQPSEAKCVTKRKIDKEIEGLKYTFVEFIRKLHKDTSRKINKLNNTPGRKVWHQYWDYCVRGKPDFWFHFNYIIKNPLKHGLVVSLNEAYYYPYSSNPVWLERFDHDGLWEGFVHYPVREEVVGD